MLFIYSIIFKSKYSENKTPRCSSRSFDFYGALTYDNNNLKVMHPLVREQGVRK